MTTEVPYPMAVYSPTGQFFLANDEQERDALLRQWAEPEQSSSDEVEEPVKRGPGRPRKIIP